MLFLRWLLIILFMLKQSLYVLLIFLVTIGEAVKAEEFKNMENELRTATLGGGCFWCVEAIYDSIKGVEKVVSGYAGGSESDANYSAVSGGGTKHAEVVQISFNPSVISFAELLEIFFHTHDPTTLNRQGADRGTQYRSVIFYHDEKQKLISQETIKKISKEKLWPDPIVTEISALDKFYIAEDYHQNYYKNNPNQPYCSLVIGPKIQKLKKDFAARLKKQ